MPLSRRLLLALMLMPGPALAGLLATPLPETAPDWTLPAIDGGTLRAKDFAGHPLLLVNTASLCGFAPQLEALQSLHETYGPQGLVVLAVPSDDFRQELGSNAEVKKYCALTFGLTLPMAEISPVTGEAAVPLYRWLAETAGFHPRWNFNKVLFDGQGHVIGTWGSTAEPLGGEIEAAIKGLL